MAYLCLYTYALHIHAPYIYMPPTRIYMLSAIALLHVYAIHSSKHTCICASCMFIWCPSVYIAAAYSCFWFMLSGHVCLIQELAHSWVCSYISMLEIAPSIVPFLLTQSRLHFKSICISLHFIQKRLWYEPTAKT